MIEINKDIFRRFRLSGWLLPLVCGVTAGWFGMTCLEVWLERRGEQSRPLASESSMSSPAAEADGNNMMVFLKNNPFKVSPMPDASPEQDAPPQVTGSLAAAVLKGTSPGYMAWLEEQGKLHLVALGGTFDAYTLEEVTYLDATFVKDGQRVVKEILYGEGGTPPPRQSSPRAGPSSAARVTPSVPGGSSPGVVDRNTVNRLLENPFDELKKVRIRPAPAGQGLRVEWIQPDSILAQLGVKENDVVRAVNGIVFRNAMDISNSLNSLMASDQFVVEVERGGKPSTLSYEVR